MIISLRNNKKLLGPKRSFLNQKKEFIIAAHGEVKLRKASKQELRKIRKKILQTRRQQLYINIGICCILVIILTIGTIAYVNHLTALNTQLKQIELTKNSEKYLEFIKDGDQWLEKRSWHNSIFQYKKALEIFPNEYDINYRLVYVYCLRCENEYLNCQEAKNKLDKLLKKFPGRTELIQLKAKLEYEY